ncbi:MAG: hypothetical protein A2V65_08975 [Deltaproteobacteria bacterium RBG_13_49_15]|nr:MAG: hypothetical protein A2V65_08975 [Deltaproteobacteria bacterium RBG_13_49_15]
MVILPELSLPIFTPIPCVKSYQNAMLMSNCVFIPVKSAAPAGKWKMNASTHRELLHVFVDFLNEAA